RAKLSGEGLFDQKLKRPLPFLPRRVGVVTSPNGAAFHDIFNVLTRRTRSVSIVLIPARVQGEFAAEEVRRGIELANRFNVNADENQKIDVLIVGRGGGSREDLWAFNEEHLARAIRASAIPIISAVGHEIDWSISDLIADRRAPTPSAAAEIVAESEAAILETINHHARSMHGSIGRRLLESKAVLQDLALSPVFSEFPQRVRDDRRFVDVLATELREFVLSRFRTVSNRFDAARQRLSPVRLASRTAEQKTRLAVLETRQSAAIRSLIESRMKFLNVGSAKLDALSPLKVLGRGYAIAKDASGVVVRSVDDVLPGDNVQIRLSDGKLNTRVESAEKN
ncbi:MAG TPA: exodeoxyribonuclease VII large subunit, partial [Pyrinomonadaceae bacterium]|nr:exodeoxyribonuclease VII large subunit [Pyrinomonadaceae bacterium]